MFGFVLFVFGFFHFPLLLIHTFSRRRTYYPSKGGSNASVGEKCIELHLSVEAKAGLDS